jgi:hypothetical protein
VQAQDEKTGCAGVFMNHGQQEPWLSLAAVFVAKALWPSLGVQAQLWLFLSPASQKSHPMEVGDAERMCHGVQQKWVPCCHRSTQA